MSAHPLSYLKTGGGEAEMGLNMCVHPCHGDKGKERWEYSPLEYHFEVIWWVVLEDIRDVSDLTSETL